MRTNALPIALLAAALGLALSYTKGRSAREAIAISLGCSIAIAIALFPLRSIAESFAFNACWVSLFVTAGSVHLPLERMSDKQTAWIERGLAINAGIWSGVASHVSGGPAGLVGMVLVLLSLAGRAVVARRWDLALKVVCSWLMAIAVLELGLNLVPTPGYVPDHME